MPVINMMVKIVGGLRTPTKVVVSSKSDKNKIINFQENIAGISRDDLADYISEKILERITGSISGNERQPDVVNGKMKGI